MKAEFSHDAISKDGTTREIKKKLGRTIKELICVTIQHRVYLSGGFYAFKDTKGNTIKIQCGGEETNISWVALKSNSRLLKGRCR